MTKQKRDRFIQQLIDELANHHVGRLSRSDRDQISQLLATYYRHISIADLEDESVADLVGAAIAHWQLLREHKGIEPLIRVYNPNFEEHGWQSQHTIIEVVSRDMVFLVDSLSMGLNRMGLNIDLTVHPVFHVVRDKKGGLKEVVDSPIENGHAESMIRFQVEKQVLSETLIAIENMVKSVITDVNAANRDWLEMKTQVQSIQEGMGKVKLPVSKAEQDEAKAFLAWMVDNHFTFLAYCEFDLSEVEGKLAPVLDRGSVLGLFKEGDDESHDAKQVIPIPGDTYLNLDSYLVVTKSNTKSAVHRPAFMDFIGLKAI